MLHSPLRTIVLLGLSGGLSFFTSAAEPTLRVADSLAVDGVPPIPLAIVEAASQYANSRPSLLVDWHPMRREILIGTRFAETVQVHLVRQPGGARTQLTFFPEPVSSASFEPTKGEFLVLTKSVGGNEFDQLYRFDFATGKTSLLTDGTSRNSAPVWSPSGKQVVYSSTRRTKADTDIWVMNPRDPKSDRLVAENKGGGWAAVDWSPDEKNLLVLEYVSANETYLWLFDVASGARTPLTPAEPGAKETVNYDQARFAKDGSGVFLTTDKGSEFERLAFLDLSTKKLTFANPGAAKWDVDALALSKDGRHLAYTTNEDGVSVLRIVEAKGFREIATPKLDGPGVISALHWNSNGTEIGFSFASARSPNDVYSYQLTSGKVERWTEGETGGLDPQSFSQSELIHWKSFDDLSIGGFLYRPSDRFKGKRPVVINIHGGPEAQARPGYLSATNYYLNELGVAVIYPNVRGSSGYGKTYLARDNGYRRFETYRDVEALLDWIKQQPNLDAERVMVTGGSYGGHMTLAIAAFFSDRIRCSLPVVGISNLVTFLKNTESYRRDLRRVEYGDERDPDMNLFLERIAPLNSADKIKAPMLVVQGRNDPRVPFTEAEQIVSTLKKQGTPVWYILGKDEGHGFRKKVNSDYQFYATILFMQRFLLN